MKNLAVLLSVLALVLTGCGEKSSDTTTLNVFAAASLQEAFTALGKDFEKEHPGTRVVFNFGPSSGLAEQINAGSPADVFAAASTDSFASVSSVVDGRDFATNTMEIAVPADNPAKITGLAQLTRKGVKLAVCQAEVPCGKVAAKVFGNAHLQVHPVTEEADVKSVLTKVALGEVDAGIVYVSDVKTGKDIVGIPIPPDLNAVTTYPISDLAGSKHTDLAAAFVALVLSSTGQQALRDRGFAPAG